MLPDSVILRICTYLSFLDLQKLCQTCQRLYAVTTDPILWSRFNVSLNNRLRSLEEFTRIRRFKSLKSLDLSCRRSYKMATSHLCTLFDYLACNRHLQTIRFSNCDLSVMPGFPLTKGLEHIPSLFLQNCNLTTEQLVALLSGLLRLHKNTCTTASKMETLDLSSNVLTHVPADLISAVASVTQNFNLTLTDLESSQSTEMLSKLNTTCIEKLDLNDLNLQTVPCAMLALVVSNLKSVGLSNTNLSDEQKVELFHRLSEDESKVTNSIDLSGVSLTCLDPGLLVSGLTKTKNLNLQYCWLTQTQLSLLMESFGNSSVEILDLRGNDCSCLTAEQLLTAAMQLQRINLSSTKLPVSTILEFAAVQGPDDRCTIVLSHADVFPAISKATLSSTACIQLTDSNLPLYNNEDSCNYGELTKPVTLDESYSLWRI